MEYIAQINDRDYELPKRTLAVEEKMENIKKLNSSPVTAKKKYESKVKFIAEILGDENAKEILDITDLGNLADMDLGEVDSAVKGIIDGYDRPGREKAVESNLKMLGSPMFTQLLKVAEGMDKLQNALDKNND